jgi:hypothetical protein
MLVGKSFHIEIAERETATKYTRYAIQMPKKDTDCLPIMPGKHLIWNPEKVSSLLTLFKEERLGVRVTEAGCFSPLYSLAGIMLGERRLVNKG